MKLTIKCADCGYEDTGGFCPKCDRDCTMDDFQEGESFSIRNAKLEGRFSDIP